MKKKINEAQKNALRLVSLLRVRDYKKHYMSLTLFIIIIAFFVLAISYKAQKNNHSDFVKACERHSRDAAMIVNSGGQLERYLLGKIEKCKESIQDFKIIPNQELCEYAIVVVKKEADRNKTKLSKTQKILVNYCLYLKSKNLVKFDF